MFNQAVARTGIKFGVIGAVAGFIVTLLLYLTGNNPYGQLSWWGWIFIPVVIFWGLSDFKKFHDRDLVFFRAFLVGLVITFFLAVFSALLIYIFGLIAGPETLQQHISEMKVVFGKTSEEALKAKVLTPEVFTKTYKQIENTTLTDLVLDVFVKKLFIGFLTSIVGAVFFRK